MTVQTRPTVLYVGGVIRSGSTLLHRMLGELPGFVAVGELVHLWRYSLPLDHDCGCGEPFSTCPFWSQVGERAFGGWDRLDAVEMLELQTSLDGTRDIPLLLAPKLSKDFAARLDRYTDVLERLYAAVAEVAGAEVVVDSSKHPGAAYLLRHVDTEYRVVRIVRDPRGVAYSCAKRVRRPEKSGPDPYMTVWETRRIARNWLTTNVLVGALPRFGVREATVHYEALVADPAAELRRALGKLGLDVPEQLPFLDGNAARLSAAHTLDGNPMRFERGPVILRPDDEWRQALPDRDRRVVEAITWPLRRMHGYRAGTSSAG